jgi:hypothetical protein
MDPIYQAEDTDKWQISVNKVVSFPVTSKSENFFATWESIIF